LSDALKGDIALWASAAASLVSFAALYYSKLQPGRAVGGISYAMIWRFSNLPDYTETDFAFSPAIWITNVGARPLLVVNLRLRLRPKKSSEFKAYPVTSIPEEALSNSGEFNSYGRLTTGSPFRALALAPQQLWGPSYKFGIEKEHRDKLVGPVTVHVELKIKDKWKTVCTDTLQFGSQPIHLRPLIGPVMTIPVYTRR
jgi:hypothetical protein